MLSVQMPLIVKIERTTESGREPTKLNLRLTPRRDWGGRGLLGCHLIPI